MNISMRAKTERDALVEGLMYYQRWYSKTKKDFIELNSNVSKFIDSLNTEEGD